MEGTVPCCEGQIINEQGLSQVNLCAGAAITQFHLREAAGTPNIELAKDPIRDRRSDR